MPFIGYYIPPSADFGPVALSVMGEAYDRALASFSSFPDRPVREMIAQKIIELAQYGVLDPIKLCEEALAAYGMQSKCGRPLNPPDPEFILKSP